MDRIRRGKYITPNNYKENSDLIDMYINQLYGRSLELYKKRYVDNNPTGTAKIDIDKIQESLGYIDDYLYYYYETTDEETFLSIFKNLVDSLKFVTVFPPSKRGLYGEYVEDEKTLYINPQLHASAKLSSDERTRLYVCHELGHVINAKWMNNLLPILTNMRCSKEDKNLIYAGFSLLDEATTQDRAETITYHYSSKKRPNMSRKISQLFDNNPYESNFDYYGELQMPAIEFARTLKGMRITDNNDLVMKKFNDMSLREDFSARIFDEYREYGHSEELIDLLKNLGIIKNASYAVFGYSDRKYLKQSSNALEVFNKLVKKVQDDKSMIKSIFRI